MDSGRNQLPWSLKIRKKNRAGQNGIDGLVQRMALVIFRQNQQCVFILVLTYTDYRSIVTVCTVIIVLIPPTMRTTLNKCFSATAAHIAQPYEPFSPAKPSISWSTENIREPKLMTNN